ncbi:hypothetical protein E8E13_010723 [Curvularia kusanoi]|uniref:Uncharacterized protein n=1 Tax=Curvularia kusanoi TaxID=90978 RepID=A0A9P4WCC9_CURKU|nr:hypothetical protein E8E13_010723 [Curvularia kusanoi]
MSSKRLFSWSKRQSSAEPYYKTGGLLPIECLEPEASNNAEAQDSQTARRRPSNLSIVPPDHQQVASSPLSSPYNVARISSASNLMSIFNDMLRSPALSAGASLKSASAHNLRPARPRSASAPWTPNLPELPGSILQQNEGYPYFETPDFSLSPPTSQNNQRAEPSPGTQPEDEGDVFDILRLFPEPLNHSRSVPNSDLSTPGAALALKPTPNTPRPEPAEETSATSTTPDDTIATLRSQFRSLRTSHEAHVSSLAEAHAAELASLQSYARLLEQQLAQRPNLQHNVTTSADPQLAYSRNLPGSDNSCSSPSRESSHHTAGTSASSRRSSRSGSDKQLPASPQDSAEMESLKRKLSTTRRPSTADRNLLPELNQYKQNNAALQTQISSLMAKLNESKKREKALKVDLDDVEQRREEAERKISEAEEIASSARALQNTIDHLENRLEIANTEKLDAQEELFNMRALKSPFDASFPELQDAHESMDTVFSHTERRDSGATISQYAAHIEHLEDEARHKDAYIADLEENGNQLRQMLDQVNQQYDEMSLQFDIHTELLGKVKESDAQLQQLRAAVLDRESVIAEKEKSVRAVERQLEHHKLLLQAEIRKHATTSRYLSNDSNPLPELTALATQKDIDKWIEKLNQRLRKTKPTGSSKATTTVSEAHIEDLRSEIDFYVREIIYYKLDIRGYKSDIKKLNKIMAQLGNCGNRSDLDSDTSSLRPAPTPRSRFTSMTPESELRGSERSSSAMNGRVSASMGSARVLTPPLSTTADSRSNSLTGTTSDALEEAASRIPITSQTPTKITIVSAPNTTPIMQRPDTQRSFSDSTFHMSKSATKADESLTHDDHAEMLALAMGNPDMPFIHNATPATATDDSRPTLERNHSDASTARPVIPTSKYSRDLPPISTQQFSHSRVGSESSVLTYNLQTQTTSPQVTSPRLERRVSNASSTGIPFVIAMTSPHNPAIAVAAKNMPSTRSQKLSSTSRAGVDGTMASSTPLSTPANIANASHMTTANSAAPHKRKLSLSFRKQDKENEAPNTPTHHSRSLSGGSIRSAIRWTKGSGKEKEKDVQVRKDSVQPLGSPMDFACDTNMPGFESSALEPVTTRNGERI